MEAAPAAVDRRRRRRLETIEEVLDVAAELMAEQGAAGLSVGEVARRMGIRPPSLYVYFPSKNALYDALFARGWQLMGDAVADAHAALHTDVDLRSLLLQAGEAFVRWAVEHPAFSQLMIWRPVPRYTPAPEAYAPAVEQLTRLRTAVVELRQRGLLRPDADVDEVIRDWTILTSGVISQQLANAPEEGFADGRYVAALPALVDMFVTHYGAAGQ